MASLPFERSGNYSLEHGRHTSFKTDYQPAVVAYDQWPKNRSFTDTTGTAPNGEAYPGMATTRKLHLYTTIGLLLFFVYFVIIVVLSSQPQRVNESHADDRHVIYEQLETLNGLRQKYDFLVARMLEECSSRTDLMFSSSFVFNKTRFYPMIVSLGEPVIPLLIEDLIGDPHAYYALCLLDDLLPDVNLDDLYGRLDNGLSCRTNTSVYRKYWLQWWDECGSRKRWGQ